MDTKALVLEVRSDAYLLLYKIRQRERSEIRKDLDMVHGYRDTGYCGDVNQMCLRCQGICGEDSTCH